MELKVVSIWLMASQRMRHYELSTSAFANLANNQVHGRRTKSKCSKVAQARLLKFKRRRRLLPSQSQGKGEKGGEVKLRK